MSVTRRLAAILALDVVGYSRLIEADEAGTLAALRDRRKTILEPLVAQHRGRIVKLMGDGALVEFASAVDAVQCAVELQERMGEANAGLPDDRRVELRVGANLGDVVVEDGDLYGDGINVAARLEAMADAGSIYISGKVQDEVRGKLTAAFDDLGEHEIKNITKPVRVFRVRGGMTALGTTAVNTVREPKPSIAILPFTNMSGDPEQQYFSDGISEDIITELSRYRLLTVIARNSSFRYRDNSADIRRIGRDLGVEYVVEGSVRKAGNRIRVTAQLIEAVTGKHLWAEHYDRDLEDIFVIQDEIVRMIVGTLPGRIEAAAARSAQRKRPANLAAWDYLLRGFEYHLRFEEAQAQAARDMYEKAIALDPALASAYAHLALVETRGWWVGRSPEALERAYKLAKKAVALDENDGWCHSVLGYVELERRQFDRAEFHINRAVALNPNYPDSIGFLAALLAYTGRPDEAVSSMGTAFRLNPYAPQAYHSSHGMVLYAARRYAEAIAAFGRITSAWCAYEYIYAVASYGQLGRIEEARAQIAASRALHPDLSLLQHAAHEPYKEPADLDHLLEGLRKAGLTE
jgi:TolB-like protein/Tfp pilus assembly protein PilF